MEDLILKGPITKYSMQPPAETKGPVSEILKNYLDVSGVVFGGLRLRGDCERSQLPGISSYFFPGVPFQWGWASRFSHSIPFLVAPHSCHPRILVP